MQVDLKFKIKAGDGQITFPIYRVPVSGGTEPVDAGDIQNLQVDLDRQVLQSSQEGVMVTAAYSNVAEGAHQIVIAGALNNVAFALVYAVRAEELGVPAEVVAPNAYVSLAPTGEGTIEQQIKDLQDRMGTAEGEIVAITAALPDLATKEEVQETLGEILAAIQALPDGQAVSAQVALNTAAIEGLQEDVSQLGQEIRIPITAWSTNWNGQITAAGQYGYNPSTKVLKKCTEFRTTAEESVYENVALSEDTIYVYKEGLFLYDGNDLVNKSGRWVHSYGIIDDFSIESGKAVNYSTGTVSSVSECAATGFIDVSCFKSILYANWCITGSYSYYGMAFYNSSKEYISGDGPYTSQPSVGYKPEHLTVPEGAKYARFTLWNEDNGTVGIAAIKQSFYLLANAAADDMQQVHTNAKDFGELDNLLQLEGSKFSFTDSVGAINNTTGEVVSPTISECRYTDYIDVSGNPAIVVNFLVATSPLTVVGLAYYDTSKNYLSGIRADVGSALAYERKVFIVPDGAKYIRCTFWNSAYSGMSQFADKFYIYGYSVAQLFLEEIPKAKFELPVTTWLATARNYILKLEGSYLYHSDDLGVTWKSLENTIGDIEFVHWFADGTCLICGEESAYYTRDFESLNATTIYDLDGTIFQGGSHNFFHEFSYNNPYNLIDGKETAVWTDYDNSQGYISRLWMSDDNGQTIRCILKNGESIVDGEILSITHFHHCVWDKYAQCLWVSTGDYNNGNKLIRGTIQNGVWTFTTIAQGNEFKFGMILYDEIYLYLITDITHGDAPRGLVKVNKASINDANAYSYIYKNPDNVAFISYYESNGIKVLFPDGAAANKGKVYIADGDVNFAEYDFVCSDGQSRILGQSVGPNYNGDLIAITYAGYGSGYKLNMSRYLLSVGMANAGFKDFNKTKLV